MKKLNSKGFGTVEIAISVVLICLIGAVGWFVWHGRQVNSINDFNACVDAGGTTDLEGVGNNLSVPTCEIYGNKFSDTGKVAWDVGLRYTDATYSDKLPPATVINTSIAPDDLVEYLENDNAGCDLDGKIADTVIRIVKVVYGTQAKIMYGCGEPDSYSLVVKVQDKWRYLNPTNMFTEEGVPNCAMVLKYKISKNLEPKCFTSANEKVIIKDNTQ